MVFNKPVRCLPRDASACSRDPRQPPWAHPYCSNQTPQRGEGQRWSHPSSWTPRRRRGPSLERTGEAAAAVVGAAGAAGALAGTQGM